MRKARRITALLLAAAVVMAAPSGCGNPEERKSKAGPAAEKTVLPETDNGVYTETAASEEEAEGEKVYTVTMVFPCTEELSEDWEEVEAAMSDYCLKKAGAGFAFRPVPFFGYTDQYALWAASGEQVDLWLLTSDLQKYADDGIAKPLTGYLDSGLMPNLSRLSKELDGFLESGCIDEELYRVGVVQPTQGDSAALKLRADVFGSIAFEDDGTGKELYTYSDLDEIFYEVHEAFPELIVIDQCGTKTGTGAHTFIDCDLFSDGAGGAVMHNSGTELVNLFETDEYYEFVSKMREWYVKGYFDPDCATTSETSDEWMYAKKTATFGFTLDSPGGDAIIEAQYGLEFKSYRVMRMGISSSVYGSMGWIVSCNSGNFEKAARVLDLMYEESGTLINYIMFGIEGKHYVLTDDRMIAAFPEGIDRENTGYYYTLGLYGDKRKNYLWYPQTSSLIAEQAEYTAWSQTHASDIAGYSFYTAEVQEEINAVSQVFSKYLSTLEYGLADTDETLSRFNRDLKAAGIESIIDENRAQLEAWLAGK